MRNSSKVSSAKILNKVYTQPNCYFSFHEGVAGSDPGDIPDQAGTSLVAAPDTATTGQWTGKPGYWKGTAANSTDGFEILRSDDTTNFDAIYNLNSSVLVQAFYVFADTDPSAGCRLMSIGNPSPDHLLPLDLKYLTTGVVQMLVTGTSSQVAQNFIDLPAEASPNEAVCVHVLDTIGMTATSYTFFPGTKTLMTTAVTSDISGTGVPTTLPTNSKVCIGRSFTAGDAAVNHAKNISVRDYRAIHFDSAPSNLSDIIEEIAVNCSLGTRR